MASLVLGLAGQAVGGPIGGALGAIAGSVIDGLLFQKTVKREGPRLSDLKFTASVAGAAIPEVWGKIRVSGQLIWATNFKETQTTETEGGKGGGGQKVKTRTFTYSVSAAIGLCEGPITGIGRVWADGKLLRLSDYTHRLYLGSETQTADPKIVAVEGVEKTPAFRGLAYLVFEDMPLERFGNRFPQLSFETIRRPPAAEPGLEELARAVTLIPGTTEFGYATTIVTVQNDGGDATADNAHASSSDSDWTVALDALENEAPQVANVSLVVAWHGSDLRCGTCEMRPKVEDAARETEPFSWNVGGLTRSAAQVVSTYLGKPALGGAPADRAVYEAIADLKARGLGITFYPFIVMDIAAGNGLPDPYGGSEQAAYPWRGRITCHPAAGQPGTVDKTAAAATQVASFFGTAAPADFGFDSDNKHVTYSGPNEWSFRRLILHYAKLCAAAGGVDRFLIGSELVGLTQVRSSASAYPAVTQLVSLAADVRTILGSGTKISYAADWSEYHSHRPADGTNDVYFNLDPLWADANIDFVGIDNYLPLSDWRDGAGHLDLLAGNTSIYARSYLQANIEGGEYFDWYYASDADRNTQTRIVITDGAYGKPWVFRNKDIRNWWLNAHKNRPGGVESASATAWTVQSKPIVFTELGCPAVDKGSNQPNVFVDPKSAESAYPYFSNARRDDLIQRSAIEAQLAYWEPSAGHNPNSTGYSGRMIDWSFIALWTWDARPYPDFPNRSDVWSDAPNWKLGHWLTGRLGAAQLRDVVADIAGGAGAPIDASDLIGLVTGYLRDQIATARDTLAPLSQAYFFDARESQGTIQFVRRGKAAVASYTRDGVMRRDGGKDFVLTRGQESELPRQVALSFYAGEADYRRGTMPSRRLAGATAATLERALPIVFSHARAGGIADAMLFELHAAREKASFMLPPSALALDPGDAIDFTAGGRVTRFRIEEVGTGNGRQLQAVREAPEVYDIEDGPDIVLAAATPKPPALASVLLLDLPLRPDEDETQAHAPAIAAYGSPWAPVDLYRAPSASGDLDLDSTILDPAIGGLLLQALPSGPVARWDEVSVLTVKVGTGVTLSSKSDLSVLNGANALAVQLPSGLVEIVQFRSATLTALRTYQLTGLLRGQLGSDADMVAQVPAGSSFALLSDEVVRSNLPKSLARSPQYWKWGPSGKAPSDPRFKSATRTFQAIGIRPYAPVYIKATRDGSGDVTVTWIRRTRIDGDPWDGEVPIETAEAYAADIMNGAAVVRTFTTGVASLLYTAAEQIADWGSLPSSIDIAVMQTSAGYGRGAARRVTLNV